jgi:hypothetical protein
MCLNFGLNLNWGYTWTFRDAKLIWRSVNMEQLHEENIML